MAQEILNYREITPEELAFSAQIVLKAYNALAEEIGFPPNEDAAPIEQRLREMIEKKDSSCKLYGGFLGKRQVGFFALQRVFVDEEAWEITMFGVLPEEQRKGVGSRLLQDALQKVKDLQGVLAVCTIFDGNVKVKEWLGRFGFEEESTTVLEGTQTGVSLMRRDIKNPPSCEKSENCEDCTDCSSCK